MDINCAPSRYEFLANKAAYEARGLTSVHYERWVHLYQIYEFIWHFPTPGIFNGWSDNEAKQFANLIDKTWHSIDFDTCRFEWESGLPGWMKEAALELGDDDFLSVLNEDFSDKIEHLTPTANTAEAYLQKRLKTQPTGP